MPKSLAHEAWAYVQGRVNESKTDYLSRFRTVEVYRKGNIMGWTDRTPSNMTVSSTGILFTLFWHESGVVVEIMDNGCGSIRIFLPGSSSDCGLTSACVETCIDESQSDRVGLCPDVTLACFPDGNMIKVHSLRAHALLKHVESQRVATARPRPESSASSSGAASLPPDPVSVSGTAFGFPGHRPAGIFSLLPAIRLPGAARRRREAAAAAAAAKAAAEWNDPTIFDPDEEVVGQHVAPREGLRVVLRARAGRADPALEAAYGGGLHGTITLVEVTPPPHPFGPAAAG